MVFRNSPVRSLTGLLVCLCAIFARVEFTQGCCICCWQDEQPAVTSNDDSAANTTNQIKLVVVVGAGGDQEFAQQFDEWATNWQNVADTENNQFADRISLVTIGQHEGSDNDREQLQSEIVAESDWQQLWIVLIGHGTHDGQNAKFNLRGPDVSADELKQWLAENRTPTVLINCSASSAPFINQLSGRDRVIVTATTSGYEQNFARFGAFMSKAIIDPSNDLDKDGQTSLLEAAITATREVDEFYQSEQRLATEHAMIDDNGDGLGTPLSWFRGTRSTRKPKQGQVDGLRANQFSLAPAPAFANWSNERLTNRNELEIQLEDLRNRKPQMTEEDYYRDLEVIAKKLAELYQEQ